MFELYLINTLLKNLGFYYYSKRNVPNFQIQNERYLDANLNHRVNNCASVELKKVVEAAIGMVHFPWQQRNILKLALNSIRLYSSNMSKKALVLLSEGSEEMEFVISVDVLRRAGVEVTVAGLQGNRVLECSRQVKIAPDISLEDAVFRVKYDVVVLPGGLKGSEEFCNSSTVNQLLKEQEESGRIIAAICAAPSALKAHQVCLGKKLTSYPSIEKVLMEGSQYTYLHDKVVVDGNLITSRGPGTAFDFALAIVEKLLGKDTVNTLQKQMILRQ